MEWTNLIKVMTDYRDFVETTMLAKMPHYYELKKKITFHLRMNDTLFQIEFIAPEYWRWANFGRGPGKFPPPKVIDNWITRRKIVPYKLPSGITPTRKQLVYLISRKIATVGFKGSGFLEATIEEQQDYWETRITDAITDDIAAEAIQWLSPLRGRTII